MIMHYFISSHIILKYFDTCFLYSLFSCISLIHTYFLMKLDPVNENCRIKPGNKKNIYFYMIAK